MQLGTLQTIEALLASIGQPARNTPHRAPVEVNSRPVRLQKASRCPRGCTCRTCSENARWERIFQEKFADPSYYSTPRTRNGSSLSHR